MTKHLIDYNEAIHKICEVIGDWYLYNKENLINWENRTHRLGFAKEQLKVAIEDRLLELKIHHEPEKEAPKPKFELDQMVFLFTDRKIYYKPIAEIYIDGKDRPHYSFMGTSFFWEESELFATEKELKDYLNDEINRLVMNEECKIRS